MKLGKFKIWIGVSVAIVVVVMVIAWWVWRRKSRNSGSESDAASSATPPKTAALATNDAADMHSSRALGLHSTRQTAIWILCCVDHQYHDMYKWIHFMNQAYEQARHKIQIQFLIFRHASKTQEDATMLAWLENTKVPLEQIHDIDIQGMQHLAGTMPLLAHGWLKWCQGAHHHPRKSAAAAATATSMDYILLADYKVYSFASHWDVLCTSLLAEMETSPDHPVVLTSMPYAPMDDMPQFMRMDHMDAETCLPIWTMRRFVGTPSAPMPTRYWTSMFSFCRKIVWEQLGGFDPWIHHFDMHVCDLMTTVRMHRQGVDLFEPHVRICAYFDAPHPQHPNYFGYTPSAPSSRTGRDVIECLRSFFHCFTDRADRSDRPRSKAERDAATLVSENPDISAEQLEQLEVFGYAPHESAQTFYIWVWSILGIRVDLGICSASAFLGLSHELDHDDGTLSAEVLSDAGNAHEISIKYGSMSMFRSMFYKLHHKKE